MIREYDKEVVWDIANDFSGMSSPITDSWDGDTLLEMQKIAEACNCTLEEAAQIMIEELGFAPEDVDIQKLKAKTSIKGSWDPDEIDDDYDPEDYEPELDDWEMVSTKSVRDSDGFWTDYTLYTDGERWVTVFGDNEIYVPADGWFDMEFDSEEEARDWFDSYDGIYDEDEWDDALIDRDDDDYDEDYDDIDSAKKIKKSSIKASFTPAGQKKQLLNTAKAGADLADKLDAYLDALDKLNKKEVQIADYISTSEIRQLQEIPDLLRDIYKSIKTDLER